MKDNALTSWVALDLAPPEEIFGADAGLVKSCIEIVQNADIQSWDDAKAYGLHSTFFCATLVVRSALAVSSAIMGLQSPEAQGPEVRARCADRLRVASTVFGQAKERMLACTAVADPVRPTLEVPAKPGEDTTCERANERCTAEGMAKERKDLALILVEKVQEHANAIWKQNPTLSKRAMADYLARMGKGEGLPTGTIRQRIKHPDEM